MLAALARFSVRHRWLVLTAWVVVLLAAVAAGRSAGGAFANDLTLAGTDSQAAYDELRERFPDLAGDGMQVVLHHDDGVTTPPVQQRVEAALGQVRADPEVAAARSPYGPGQRLVSGDGQTAIASVQFVERAKDIPPDAVARAQAAFEPLADLGVQVEYGGPAVQTESGPSGAEVYGLVAAVVVLLVAFGSVFAMVVPIVTALTAVGVGLGVLELLANWVTIGTSGPVVAAMIGLGVGIDYALLVVTRHREGMAAGLAPADSIPRAMATAGRAVLVAGVTVIVAILSLYLIGVPFVSALALASAVTVAMTVLAAVTLLPALLGLFGHRLDRWRVRRIGGRPDRGWRRWAAAVQRGRWVAVPLATAMLVVLALPLGSLRLGTADGGSQPAGSTQQQAYELVARDFGAGWTGPLLVTVDPAGGDAGTVDPAGGGAGTVDPAGGGAGTVDPAGGGAGTVELAAGSAGTVELTAGALRETLLATDGVAAVAPPRVDPSGDTAVLTVVPVSAPDSAATEQLVHHLRAEVLPEAAPGSEVHVGGATATSIDLADTLDERMGWFMLLVVGLAFLVLLVEFRSFLVPLVAVGMNLLAVGAAYGPVVAVFQWGWWPADLIGARPGPVESFAPVMLFAVLFGLSTDYAVFLLSRVREEFRRTGDARRAVVDGLSGTGRVVLAAASVMVVVFASFVLNDQRVVNLFGFGLAAAVAVYAVVAMTVLIPALLTLLGRVAWWPARRAARHTPRSVAGPALTRR